MQRRQSDEILRDEQRSNAFLKAAAEGQTPRVQHFLGLDKHLVDHFDDRGYTALHHAALSGFEDTVNALLAAGADVNACSAIHGTPLHLAVIKERANVVHLLLKKRALVDLPSEALGLPLHCAAFTGNISIANALTHNDAMLEASARVSMWEARATVSIREMYAVSGISPEERGQTRRSGLGVRMQV